MIFIDHFNPSFFFQFKPDNSEEVINKLLEEEVKHSSQYTWAKSCSVQVTQLDTEKYKIYVDSWLNELRSYCNNNFQYSFEDMWLNTYNEGGFQEIHDHCDSDITIVFIVNDGPNFGKFYFSSRYYPNLSHNTRKLLTKNNFCDRYTPESYPGSVIIFPSSLSHGVTPHKSDVLRKTFSCNINLTRV